MQLQELQQLLSHLLTPEKFKDYAINGVQVWGERPIERVAFAVTASLEAIEAAIAWGADALLVHHGLFWGPTPLTSFTYRRVKRLIESGTALLAYHLPLDSHPVLGNSAVLARELGATETVPFMETRGGPMGVVATLPPTTREALATTLEQLSGPLLTLLPYGPDLIQRVGIVSGDGSLGITEALSLGCDTFVTGEPSGPSQYTAKEETLNYLCLGHEYSEQFGVKALAHHLAIQHHLTTTCLFFSYDL